MTQANGSEGETAQPAKKPLLADRYLDDFDRLVIWLIAVGMAFTLVFGATAARYAANAAGWLFVAQALRGATTALAIAAGAMSLGAAAGFLFGLPRSLTSSELRGARAAAPDPVPGAAPSAPQPGRPAYTEVNSNLEQISDWLTKIFVGVRLSLVFTISQRHNDKTAEGADIADCVRHSFDLAAFAGPLLSSANHELRAADQVVLEQPVTELTTPAQLLARANALAREAQPEEARSLYEQVLKLIPETPDLLTGYAQVLGLAGRKDESENVARRAAQLSPAAAAAANDAALDVARLQGDVLSGLYRNNGRTLADAFAALERLKQLPGQTTNPMVHVWQAYAHG